MTVLPNHNQHRYSITFIGQWVRVVIERPCGSRHPNFHTLLYELDYGFIPNTLSADGEELDAYVLRETKNDSVEVHGLCVGVILRGDGDDKLLIATDPGYQTVKPETVRRLTAFQERPFWPEEYVDQEGYHLLSCQGTEEARYISR